MDKRMKKEDLTYTEREVLSVIESRWKLGRDRYGKGISYTQQSTAEGWLDNAIEEAADMLQYLVALKLFMREGESFCDKADTLEKMPPLINVTPEDEFAAGWDREGGYFIRQERDQIERILSFMNKRNTNRVYFGLVKNPIKNYVSYGAPDVILLLSALQKYKGASR